MDAQMVITGLTCILCNEIFLVPEEFSEHLSTHVINVCHSNSPDAISEKEKVVSPTTGKTKPDVKLEKELDTEYTCEVCKKLYRTMCQLKRHRRIHNPNRKKECPVCRRKVATKWYYNHEMMHQNVEKELFKCETCGKSFGCPKHLDSHKELVHLKNLKHECGKCGKKFQRRDRLLAHESNKHSATPRARECSICNIFFATEIDFRRHRRDHEQKFKTQQCPVCLKFVTPRTLKRHKTMHAKKDTEKGISVICYVCGKSVSNLILHMRTHTGEKPFGCDQCGKSFSASDTLKSHKRIHTKERPFVCKVCNKGFTQKTPLTVHMRCHTGERPYVCEICSKKFITRGLLNGHRGKCPGPS